MNRKICLILFLKYLFLLLILIKMKLQSRGSMLEGSTFYELLLH